jgi:5-methylcytosine-specific restriction endonuclease McrA
MFSALKKNLPVEIAVRLKSSRTVRRHGNANTVFLFNIWDKNQVGLFDPKYFSYCLGYDPQHRYSPTTWYLHLWINTIRIYQYSRQIRNALEDIVFSQCPKSFEPEVNDQAVNAVIRCKKFSGDPSQFETYFLPLYEELVGTIHPYLMPIIDSFTYDLTDAERQEVIKSRQKLYHGPRHRLSPEEIRQYSRSIPGSWREKILKASGYCCAHCNATLTENNSHIDHIKPFSLGGLTVLENLQALCAPCNLAKGNRVEV